MSIIQKVRNISIFGKYLIKFIILTISPELFFKNSNLTSPSQFTLSFLFVVSFYGKHPMVGLQLA